MTDVYDLDRFVRAQNLDGTYEQAVAELRRGRKTSHWMWFVFPQIAGLGFSATSRRYAISSLDEARAYLAHPVLGSRLLECADIVANLGGAAHGAGSSGPTAEQIFGAVDAQKLHSSMTLFHRAAPDEPVFAAVLERYFDAVADPGTSRLI